MTADLIDTIRAFDTPTICNAIEVAAGRRGFANFTRSPMFASEPEAPPLVGRALTAAIRAEKPSAEPTEIIRRRRMAYYRYMSEPAQPSVAVIQDLDGETACGAFWGEINTTVHRAFGLQGVVTDGLVRDLSALSPDFPVVAGGIGVSHAFVHIVEIDGPVDIFGMTVRPGDLVHADRHGALVIPEDVTASLPDAIRRLNASEDLILGPARDARKLSFKDFERAWNRFEASRT